ERPVVVDEVDVRKPPVRDERAGDDVVAGVAVEVAPRTRREYGQDDAEHREAGQRQYVRAECDPQTSARALPQRNGLDAHAASRCWAPSRSRIPGTTRSATPITA